MNKIIELRRQRTQALNEAQALIDMCDEEQRELTDEERALYDEKVATADALQVDIDRREALQERVRAAKDEQTRRTAPTVLKHKQGDNEQRAMAAFVRTGDVGAIPADMRTIDSDGIGMTIKLPSPREMRAVVDSTMNITTAADGANMVPTGFVRDVVTRMNEEWKAPLLGCRRIPGVGTTVNYPYEAADPEVFGTTSEQADDLSTNNYERDAGNTALKAFTLVKYTRKIELTEELLEDNDVNLMAYIGDRIGRQMAKTHNTVMVAEVGSNGTALKTYASASAIAAGEPEDIVFNDTLAYYLDDSGSVNWLMRPSTFGNIASITGNARLYAQTPGGSFSREILGYPVHYANTVAATAASAKDVYFGNWDYVGYRLAPEMRMITDPYSVDGVVVLKYSFRTVYGVLQPGAIGYGVHPSA